MNELQRDINIFRAVTPLGPPKLSGEKAEGRPLERGGRDGEEIFSVPAYGHGQQAICGGHTEMQGKRQDNR